MSYGALVQVIARSKPTASAWRRNAVAPDLAKARRPGCIRVALRAVPREGEGVESSPVLHLTVGLPGAGKTTLAHRIERESGALRLTPDEWMLPLFGVSDADGKRDVLEGRLIWVAHQVLRSGLSAILDFGCWSAEERYAVREVANLSGAQFELHYLALSEAERRERADARWLEDGTSTFEMSAADHDRFRDLFVPPTADELCGPMPRPPDSFESWSAWASGRWPSLPRLDRAEGV